MPLLALLKLALTLGGAVGLITWRYPRTRTSPAPTLDNARKRGETVATHPRPRAIMAERRDPATVTGLALTLALVLTVGGGLLLGLLAYLVRTNAHLIGNDNS